MRLTHSFSSESSQVQMANSLAKELWNQSYECMICYDNVRR